MSLTTIDAATVESVAQVGFTGIELERPWQALPAWERERWRAAAREQLVTYRALHRPWLGLFTRLTRVLFGGCKVVACLFLAGVAWAWMTYGRVSWDLPGSGRGAGLALLFVGAAAVVYATGASLLYVVTGEKVSDEVPRERKAWERWASAGLLGFVAGVIAVLGCK